MQGLDVIVDRREHPPHLVVTAFVQGQAHALRGERLQLCWQQHGGSGLAVTLDDALDLPTTDRDWLIERIGSQRAREAKELEKAARNGRGRK